MSSLKFEFTCEHCGGTGKLPKYNSRCYYCHGAGKVRLGYETQESMFIVVDRDDNVVQAPSGKVGWKKRAHAHLAFTNQYANQLFADGTLRIVEICPRSSTG